MVLFVVKDLISLEYAMVQLASLTTASNVKCYITSPHRFRRQCEQRQLSDGARFIYVPLGTALLRRWSLICFPSHFCGALFHPSSPKVFLGHGIQVGAKIFGQNSYAYGWKALLSPSSTYYTELFASYEGERDIAGEERWAKPLVGRIRVVGDPAATKLLKRNEQRAEIRRDLGIPSDAVVLTLMSSWNDYCLCEQFGDSLLQSIPILEQKFFVYFSAHSRCRSNPTLAKILDRLIERKIRIVPPGPESWYDFLVATDLVITDYTSLGLYFSMLNRPMGFVAIPEGKFFDTSPLRELYHRSVRIDPSKALMPQVENMAAHPLEQPPAIKEICSFGSNDQRYHKAIHKLMT